MTRPPVSLAEYRTRIGQEVGLSPWLTVDQDRIDAFAQITEDDQFIHIDPVRARETPFGGTVAHGFLTLSLCSRMAYDALPGIQGAALSVNYGFNSLRFISPVMAGQKVRGRFVLKNVADREGGSVLVIHAVTVEIEGGDKPALVAEWLGLFVIK